MIFDIKSLPSGPLIFVEVCQQAGNELFNQKDYEKAANEYKKAIQVCDDNPNLFSNLALCYLKQKEWAEAAQASRKALLLNNTHKKALYRLGVSLMELEDYQEALACFKKIPAPVSPAILQVWNDCQKRYRITLFTQAIHVDDFFLSEKLIEATPLPSNTIFQLSEDLTRISPELILKCIQVFREEKTIPLKIIYRILLEATKILEKEKNVVNVEYRKGTKVTICGDTHGQFFDVLQIFEKNGPPSENHTYLFNGDFVDRGKHSAELCLTLLALKACYPKNIFLNRGNHETVAMNNVFGFEEEMTRKYGRKQFRLFRTVFQALPVATIVHEKYFVTHGGLPSGDILVEEINQINRFLEPTDNTLLSNLLWCDPGDNEGIAPSPRGTGCLFGRDITKHFLERNGLELLIRSHYWKEEGYEYTHDGKCLTIFSAPNYTNTTTSAAFANIQGEKLEIISFEAAKYQGF